MSGRNESERIRRPARLAICAQCGCLSGLRWTGWRAYRIDDPEHDEPPALALYCPTCAELEFG
jgi:hypothetical protein